jgi:hypothetical protein
MGALNNALSDALKSLTNNFAGIFNGTNPLTQFQIGQVLGTNIPGVPIISSRDYFLAQLNSWVSTPALQSQWILLIDGFPPALNSGMMKNLERTGGVNAAYDINAARTILTLYPFANVAGCIFANTVQIPGESYAVADASVENNRGFIPGIISGNREGYAGKPLEIGFLETNTSFIDNVMRPWVMLASHLGHVTRKDKRYNVKTNISVYFYSKTFQNLNMIPRKVFRFYNCVPTLVQQQLFDYSEKDTVPGYTVNFSYTNYTVENNLYLPLPQLIKTIQNNASALIPKVSPLQQ